MDYLNLGRSGLKVSRVALGTMNFALDESAPWCDEAEAARIVSGFLDAGGNLIDTANNYAFGQSETAVGRAIRGRREQVVLATKAGRSQGSGPNDAGLSRAHLTRALDASLQRLGVDHVDLYQLHGFDAGTPLEETMATLAGFVRAGKVRYLGCCNFTGSQIVEAQWAAERVGAPTLVALQPRYSLISREIEAEVLPTATRHGLGAVTYGPLAGGVLSGQYRPGEAAGAGSRYGGRMGLAGPPDMAAQAAFALRERNLAIAEAVASVAADLGVAPSAVAVAWLLGRRGVSSVIIGPRTAAQLEAYLAAVGLALPDAALLRLGEVSRGA